MVTCGVVAAPSALAWSTGTNFYRTCGVNNGYSAPYPDFVTARTSKVSGTCAGALGTALRYYNGQGIRLNGSVSGQTVQVYVYDPQDIADARGGYHWGCLDCSRSQT